MVHPVVAARAGVADIRHALGDAVKVSNTGVRQCSAAASAPFDGRDERAATILPCLWAAIETSRSRGANSGAAIGGRGFAFHANTAMTVFG